MLPPEIVERLNNTVWQAAELKDFLKTMLEEWGLLSSYEADWDAAKERSGSAEDGKWQVVFTPTGDTLSTNGAKKILFVSEKFRRSLTQVGPPAGALPVAAHELMHVLQNENDEIVAQQIPLAKIKGRRYLTAREMGGIYEERRVQANVWQ